MEEDVDRDCPTMNRLALAFINVKEYYLQYIQKSQDQLENHLRNDLLWKYPDCAKAIGVGLRYYR